MSYLLVSLVCLAVGFWCEWGALEDGWRYIRFNYFADLFGVVLNLVLSSWNIYNGQRNLAMAIRFMFDLPLPRRSQAVRE